MPHQRNRNTKRTAGAVAEAEEEAETHGSDNPVTESVRQRTRKAAGANNTQAVVDKDGNIVEPPKAGGKRSKRTHAGSGAGGAAKPVPAGQQPEKRQEAEEEKAIEDE